MAKRIVRLTEADIENIVKKVISEQQNNIIACPSGGVFKIEGSDLKWANNENDKFYTIWQVGAKPTFKYENNRPEADGFLELQNDIFGKSNMFNTFRSANILPSQYNWRENDKAKVFFYSLDENGNIHGDVATVISVKNETLKSADILGRILALDEDFNLPERSKDDMIIWGETYVRVKRNVNLIAVRSLGPKYRLISPPTPPTPPEKIKLPLDLKDVFKFSSIEFENPAQAEAKINEFIKSINDYKDQYGDLFRRRLNAKLYRNPILGYASIDGKSDGDVPEGKGYVPCSGQKRKDYNQCLSEARAKKVADILNKAFSDDNMINFKYKGMGETDEFDKGKKWPDYKYEETGANRRIVLDLGDFTIRV